MKPKHGRRHTDTVRVMVTRRVEFRVCVTSFLRYENPRSPVHACTLFSNRYRYCHRCCYLLFSPSLRPRMLKSEHVRVSHIIIYVCERRPEERGQCVRSLHTAIRRLPGLSPEAVPLHACAAHFNYLFINLSICCSCVFFISHSIPSKYAFWRPGTGQREISPATSRREPESTDAPTGEPVLLRQKNSITYL